MDAMKIHFHLVSIYERSKKLEAAETLYKVRNIILLGTCFYFRKKKDQNNWHHCGQESRSIIVMLVAFSIAEIALLTEYLSNIWLHKPWVIFVDYVQKV